MDSYRSSNMPCRSWPHKMMSVELRLKRVD